MKFRHQYPITFGFIMGNVILFTLAIIMEVIN